MRARAIVGGAIFLIAGEALGLHLSGLLVMLGVVALAVAGLLTVLGLEGSAQSGFSFGVGAVGAGALLAGVGGAVQGGMTVHGGGLVAGLEVLAGVATCLLVPAVGLFGLHTLARGLAALPDRPPPTQPREWRQAEVVRPDDRPRTPTRRRQRQDDLDILGGDP